MCAVEVESLQGRLGGGGTGAGSDPETYGKDELFFVRANNVDESHTHSHFEVQLAVAVFCGAPFLMWG